MSENAPDLSKSKSAKKNKPLFVISLLLLIDSAAVLAVTAIVVVLLTLSIIIDRVSFGIDISSLFSGASSVFGVALAAVAFYAALRGVWQNKLVKCKKLGIVLILLSAVSYVLNIMSIISVNDNIEKIVLQIIIYAVLSLLLPILYLVFANLALKKKEPKSKYHQVIKSI